MPRLTPVRFLQSLPEAVRPHLPPELRRFRSNQRYWFCQFYYRDAQVHYEVWLPPPGQHPTVEIGLHFERKDPADNEALRRHFAGHLAEIKAALGAGWEAELWTRRWTKVYERRPLGPLTEAEVQTTGAQMARAIVVLQPILENFYEAS